MRRELGIHGLQLLPPFSSASRAEGSPSTGSGSAVGWLSFRRIVNIPFEACPAALESWRRTGHCLLDFLIHALLVCARNAPRTTSEDQRIAIHGLLHREVLSDPTPEFGEKSAGVS